MRNIADIVALAAERKRARGPLHATQLEIRDAYNGALALPLSEMYDGERSSVANLFQLGLDGTAQRIASTMPNVKYPVARKGFKSAEEQARKKREATMEWWRYNRMQKILQRRARHFIGYASSPVILRPDAKTMSPRWEALDPLNVYPCPSWRLDDVTPYDAIICYRQSRAWLRQMYPDSYAFSSPKSSDSYNRTDSSVDLIEYVDHDELVLLATSEGATQPAGYGQDWGEMASISYNQGTNQYRWITQLERTPNKAGVCPLVNPQRVTLDRPLGQFDGMLGMYMTQARLTALELIAIEEGIFPNTWVVAPEGRKATIVQMANGRAGDLGEIQGGDIKVLNLNPGYKTDQAIDRLVEGQRLEGGIPAAMGGQAATNIRTGRQSDALLGAAIDFGIAEAQKMFEESLEHEVERGIAIMRGFFGNRSVSFDVKWKSAPESARYRPNDLFDSDRNIVKYSFAGTDENALNLRIGQQLGEHLISTETARALTPNIEDPELEGDLVMAEVLEQAILAQIQQPGAMSVPDLARVRTLVRTNQLEIDEAIQKVQEEAQQRQASSGAPGTPEGPVDPMSPEAQPGIAPPGMGAEAATIGPNPDQAGLSQLLNTLRSGQSPALRNPAA